MDGDFVSDSIVGALDLASIEYTLSVSFERLAQLKAMIENRRHWYVLDQQQDYFETRWKPKDWGGSHRFVFVRQRSKIQYKEPVQSDHFIPYEFWPYLQSSTDQQSADSRRSGRLSQW